MARPSELPDDLGSAFRRAWVGSDDPATACPELLPVRLARACVAVLPVDGAGLSLHETEVRVPVGGSDDRATMAERLQFTQGHGPCLESAATRRILAVNAADMEARWPAFADELFRRTPFRAILSVPLAVSPRTYAALDLYLIDEAMLGSISAAEISALSAELVGALGAAVASTVPDVAGERDDDLDAGGAVEDDFDPALLPRWLSSAPARARSAVWVAMGMAMTHFRLTAQDALSMLRSFAYGQGRMLDDIAADLVEGRLDLVQLD